MNCHNYSASAIFNRNILGCKDFTEEEEDIFKLDLIET